VRYPFKKWKGYTFVEAPSKTKIDQFLALKSISIEGNELIIKPFLKGNVLEQEKGFLRCKRIFVRVVSKCKVDFTFENYFKRHG
jgi:hypothetical protein